ncbi:MAG: MFS transporter [Smithellaceae bacterium]|nr:MFS transporter [Smithellaceae bacterium]
MKRRAIFGGMMPLFVMGHFSHHILTSVTTPLLPFIRSSFDLDYTQAGLVVSAFLLSYGFGHLPAGWLADRLEPRKLMTIGISGVALAGIMVGLTQSYFLLLLFLVLMGLLAGGYHPSAPPLISASVPPEHLGRSLGFHNIGGGASHLVAPLVAVAIAGVWGWRSAYIAIAVPTLLFGAFFYYRLGRLNEREKEKPSVPRKEGVDLLNRQERMRRLVIFLILTTLTGAIINAVVSFIPLLIVDHFGRSAKSAAVYLAILYSAVFWASPLGGYLSDRLGSIRVVLTVCFFAGPVIFLLTILPGGWGLSVILLLLGTIIFARMSASETYIVSLAPPEKRSTILGIYFFSGMEGGGILTPILGYMIDHIGFSPAFALMGATASVLTLICAFWLREGRQKAK